MRRQAQPPPRGLAGMRPKRSPRPAPRPRAGTRGVASRRVTIARRPPPKSTTNRMLERLAGMLPGVGAGKRRGRGRRGAGATAPAGLALLAGAGGMAFKNRDKLIGLLRGRSTQDEGAPAPPVVQPGAVEHVPEAAAPDTPPAPAAGLDVADAPAANNLPRSDPPSSTPP
jgi:hypothetical protein